MRSRIFAAAALAAAAVTTGAGAALAVCPGTTQLGRVCVNPGALPNVDPDGSSYEDCVYTTDPDNCDRVVIPIPTVEPGEGDLVTISCGSWGSC